MNARAARQNRKNEHTMILIEVGKMEEVEVDKGLGLKVKEYRIGIAIRKEGSAAQLLEATMDEATVKSLGTGKARTYLATKIAAEAIMGILRLEEPC